MTYQPAPLPEPNESAEVPSAEFEKPYIASLFNPTVKPYDPTAPVEIHVHRELSNQHSRAKKQARWQARRALRRTLMEETITAELQNLNGRTKKEARVDAIFKWNEKMRMEDRKERERRWIVMGGQRKAQRKATRKQRKQTREADRLRRLVLEPGPNQIIPPEAEMQAAA